MSLLRNAIRASSASDITNPNLWLASGGYGRKTVAGESVNPATALTLSTWFACIRAISEDVGKLPFEIFKKLPRGKERALTHPVYTIVNATPNPESAAMTFRETITGWALGWGNGYAEIERDGSGTPVALWPIHPSRVRVLRVDGQVFYDVLAPELEIGKAVRLPARDVLHIRGFGDHPLIGLSTARMAAESLGLSMAAQTFGAAFFGNGANLGYVLEHPGTLSEKAQDRLRKSVNNIHQGAGKAHKLAIFEEGMKANRVSVPPEEAQFIETRSFQINDIARFFRMPVHKIQQMEGATFTNIEQQAIEYVVDCLTSWLTRWEQECSRKLLAPREVATYLFQHNVIALLRGDSTTRSNFSRTMISAGVMTINEAREIESLNPVDPEEGDVLFMQGAMTTVKLIVDPPAPPPAIAPPGPAGDPADDQVEKDQQEETAKQVANFRPILLEAEQRCRRKEEMAIANAVRKHGAGSHAFASWATGFYAGHLRYFGEAMAPATIALDNALRAAIPARREYATACNQAFVDFCENARRHVIASGSHFIPEQSLTETLISILTLEPSHV